jgi:hypothetical protein
MSFVAQATLRDVNRDLIRDLKSNSQVLDRIRDSFSRLLEKRTFVVWSLLEELPMAGVGKVPIPRKFQTHVV